MSRITKAARTGLIRACIYLCMIGSATVIQPALAQATLDAQIPPPIARPAAGVMENRTGRSPEAPFEIITSSGADYYLKLVDSRTGQDAITVYVRGGQRIEVTVPLGTYRLRYAAGEIWRGASHLFGPGEMTMYNESGSIFNFDVSSGYVNGYTVELIRQVGGNMDTRQINPSQF